jgi:hypothetical protein
MSDISPDRKYFFFTSERGFADQPLTKPLTSEQLLRQIRGPGNGLEDIYKIDARVIVNTPPAVPRSSATPVQGNPD